MQKILMVVVVSSVVFLEGCASVVKYSTKGELYGGNGGIPTQTVLVDILEDARSDKEKEGKVPGKGDYAVTSDKMFKVKPGVNTQISDMLGKHLKATKAFKEVLVEDVDNALISNPQKLQDLQAKGVDLVVQGNLNHFYGYQSDQASAGAAVMFGAIGVLAEAMMNPKTVGANAEYGDIMIIDVPHQTVLWNGDLNYTFEEIDKWYDGALAYALRALKELNNQLAEKLDTVKIIKE